MRKQDGEYDYHRYREMLADASDERKRLALIALLIEEKARDRLAAERASDRAAMTAMTVAKVLGNLSTLPDRPTAAVRLNLVPLRLVKDAR
jgi:ABC-type ATPase with predicted acetyltransferase domain